MYRRAAYRYLALLLLSPGVAAASASVSFGAGGAVPVGDISHLDGIPSVRELIPAPLPFRVDLEGRFHPHYSAAAHLELAHDAGCLVRSGCSSRLWGVGVSGRIRPIARPQLADPWISAGVGYSRLEKLEPGGITTTWEGPHLLTLSAGVDLAVGGRLAITPYLSASWGLYLANAASQGEAVRRADVPSPSIHGLFGAGLRVTLSDAFRGFGGGISPDLQRPHPAAVRYDEAYVLHQGRHKLAALGRAGLVRQRLEEIIRLCDAALAELEQTDAGPGSLYFTETAGALSRKELVARLNQLRDEASGELSALTSGSAAQLPSRQENPPSVGGVLATVSERERGSRHTKATAFVSGPPPLLWHTTSGAPTRV